MKNKGLFSTLFIEDVKGEVRLDDMASGRMATLAQKWQSRDKQNRETLWNSFLKQAVSYLHAIPGPASSSPGVYPLYDDYSFLNAVTVLYLIEPGADLDDTSMGRFWPGKLIEELKRRNLNWGILTDGACWRLYSLKTAKPYEDFVELNLADALGRYDEAEYALFERFFHRDSFVKEAVAAKPGKSVAEDDEGEQSPETGNAAHGVYKCRLDRDREASEKIIEKKVKDPLLSQVDEVLQYLCNGFIADTERAGTEYSEEERKNIFESAVKLLYRCLFLFYAEARSLLPSEPDKTEVYRKHSILNLCQESHRFKWGTRKDHEGYDLWKHLKGLVNAVNDGDPEYGIMGYNGGLFDDTEEKFLGKHKLRNDYLARALYLLAYVEPLGTEPEDEYPIPYVDLEVRHLGELYENILEFNVTLADADRIRRRTKKGVQIVLASETKLEAKTDSRIRKGDVYFGETALERKQSGSYYTPETLVHFLNQKAVINPLRERFDKDYRPRFADFCKEAVAGRDLSTRRGAAQAAIALVERFVEEVVLKFRVCDAAMGSGHFLVNCVNQLTDLVVGLLAEVPFVEGLKSRVSCSANHWRRLITRHCVYGVDLNPLSVHLAKLSLWLNCFARDHKLTFLDHHVKPGNSLIGIRVMSQLEKLPERTKAKKKAEQTLLFPTDLKKACHQVVTEIEKIGRVEEDDTDRMKALHEQAKDETRSVYPLANLYTAYLMDHSISEEDYREIFSDLANGRKPNGILAKDILEKVAALVARHRFFHWALEFPEVFGGENTGFCATVGNPPWDTVKPSSQEFFVAYDPGFRGYGKQEAVKVANRLMEEHPTIRQKWEEYGSSFDTQSLYFRQPAAYVAIGGGDINTFKLFIEQFFALLGMDGHLGIVVPSGIYTDQGCKPLRELLFNKSRIQFIYGFENRWPTVFPAVDGRFKFVVLSAQKGGKTIAFKCVFMGHDPERLPAIDCSAFVLSMDIVRQLSPDSLSLIEFKGQKDVDITTQTHVHPKLSEVVNNGWRARLTREFDSSLDSHLFNTDGNGCPLLEGKLVAAFDSRLQPVSLWIDEDKVRQREMAKYWKNTKPETQHWNYRSYRCGFRRIAASTNERACFSTVIPIGSVCPDTTITFVRYELNEVDNRVTELISSADTLWLTGVLNSFVYDYLIRMCITTHLDMHFVYAMPIPRIDRGDRDYDLYHFPILCRCLRLVCTTEDYAPLWEELFDRKWRSPAFWYPSPGLGDYGPEHERDLRKRMTMQLSGLTPQWSDTCAVHDRLPDRRDTGDRAQLRAEIDAYVAHLYGLSRQDFEHIFGTFPVLEKKERKAFGEFISKRKCLEEYDRIAGVLSRGEKA